MCLKRGEEKNIRTSKNLFLITFKKNVEAATGGVLKKNWSLKLRIIHWKRPVLETFFSSEYCEIFKSTYFEEHCERLLLKMCS